METKMYLLEYLDRTGRTISTKYWNLYHDGFLTLQQWNTLFERLEIREEEED